MIILESSTYPGSTKDLILPFLKKFKVGHNFFVGYSPEREDPNNKKYNLENIPKICSGYSTYCKKLTSHLYKKILKKVKNVTDINVAEFVKLYENIYRSVNIGLVNELKIVATELGLNIYEIIDAQKQSFWISSILSWSRSWWALYSNRSILLVLDIKRYQY